MMTRKNISLVVSKVLLSVAFAQAQTGDWQAVEHLSPGTKLKILLSQGRTLSVTASSWQQLTTT
jgi:hypothetical protein